MKADECLQGVLQHVPKVDLVFDGDCAQSAGLNLPIAVINLAHRTDRWQAVSSRMAAIGLNKLIKVPAIEGARLLLDQISVLWANPPHSSKRRPGAITRSRALQSGASCLTSPFGGG